MISGVRVLRLAAVLALSACTGKGDGASQGGSSGASSSLSAPEPARFGKKSDCPQGGCPSAALRGPSAGASPAGGAAPAEGRRSDDAEFAASLGLERAPAAPAVPAGVPVPDPEPAPAVAAAAPAAERRPAAAPQAVLYTELSWCHHCRVLEAKLAAKPRLRALFREGGGTPPDGGGIPALQVGGRWVRGPDAIIAALESL